MLPEKERTFAQKQLGESLAGGLSLLGLGWNKERDQMVVSFPEWEAPLTKRGVLCKLASIYDPLGLVSPVTLVGKCLYRDVCCEKLAWEAKLAGQLKLKWKRWERNLPKQTMTSCALADHREPIQDIQLHGFGDASKCDVGAAVYAVFKQKSGTSQHLVATKARLAKQGLSMPRLELISAHMATNFLINVKVALEGLPVSGINGWLDSSVALYWIQGSGQYKQFVENRVQKIVAHPEITWRHVPSQENPADVASRGGDVVFSELWWNGPDLISDRERWPSQSAIQPSEASKAERKATKELFKVAVDDTDRLYVVLEKFEVSKALNIGALVSRFVDNLRNPEQKVTGPVMSEEFQKQHLVWVKKAQQSCKEGIFCLWEFLCERENKIGCVLNC